jgi:ABC-type sugar transport system ATPase subunit
MIIKVVFPVPGGIHDVAAGRAIVRDPAAFLMDEPLSNLDPKLRVQMRTEVSRLQKRLDTTMVYVTHDQAEAMTLGDRVAVMRGGRIQQYGAPQALYEHPDNQVGGHLLERAEADADPLRRPRCDRTAPNRIAAAARTRPGWG